MADSPHQAAAKSALAHLDAAMADLRGVFDHPHHTPRLEQLESALAGVKGQVEPMAGFEESRADRAKTLMDQHMKRQLPPVIPSHDDELLAQELERAGH